jgi:hypothetical protein
MNSAMITTARGKTIGWISNPKPWMFVSPGALSLSGWNSSTWSPSDACPTGPESESAIAALRYVLSSHGIVVSCWLGPHAGGDMAPSGVVARVVLPT